ncbi:hypothetical protein BDV93DRAFT_509069 [Ceratobasidium sp. AG-I]|nr:hypothetical protein BDV93DRAFT_509069 [Ceratobasidium sp. AG-I]
MPDYKTQCAEWSNDTLIFKEISHRRSIASYITSLTLTGGATVASMGTLAPLTLPIGAFKLYKINSHRSKLNVVRAELARRHLAPADERKRDVLVPVAVTFMVYVATLGLADVIDIVPSDVQGSLEGHVETAAGVEQGSGGLADVADKYQAFVIAEAAAPLTNAAIHPTPPPRPGHYAKDQ